MPVGMARCAVWPKWFGVNMKNYKNAAALLVVSSVLSGCVTAQELNRNDKLKHFVAGAAVAYVVERRTGSKLAGCAASFAVGAFKEHVDHNRGKPFDMNDLGATVAGCSFTFVF